MKTSGMDVHIVESQNLIWKVTTVLSLDFHIESLVNTNL